MSASDRSPPQPANRVPIQKKNPQNNKKSSKKKKKNLGVYNSFSGVGFLLLAQFHFIET